DFLAAFLLRQFHSINQTSVAGLVDAIATDDKPPAVGTEDFVFVGNAGAAISARTARLLRARNARNEKPVLADSDTAKRGFAEPGKLKRVNLFDRAAHRLAPILVRPTPDSLIIFGFRCNRKTENLSTLAGG
ncbi:MAG: hypothetical protein KGL35_19010, partial [Bradyrhizobium sp.]|nr:hypothetical protein [Bradyrhizobium sp.]